MGHGSSRPHPPHALVFQTFVHPSVDPLTATPRARAVGRAVGRAAEPEARRRRRRPHSSTIRASHVRDRAILFLRHHRVRLRASRTPPRLARSSRSRHPIDRLDRIRARGKIRARMRMRGNDGIHPRARLSRSVTTKTTTRMDACIFYALDTRRASRVPRSERAWIRADACFRLTVSPARTPTVGSFRRVAVDTMSTNRANAFSCVV